MNYVIEADINILTTTVSRLNAAVKRQRWTNVIKTCCILAHFLFLPILTPV